MRIKPLCTDRLRQLNVTACSCVCAREYQCVCVCLCLFIGCDCSNINRYVLNAPHELFKLRRPETTRERTEPNRTTSERLRSRAKKKFADVASLYVVTRRAGRRQQQQSSPCHAVPCEKRTKWDMCVGEKHSNNFE